MRFAKTSISGVVIIDLDPIADERGFFARSFDRKAFADHGLMFDPVEMNISFNERRATLRGLHYQAEPHPDAKIVRCVRGSVFDVVVDLRPGSSTFRDWVGTNLTADDRRALHIPAGCAHGFLTLEDATEVHYIMGEVYHPRLARGVRWDDPQLGIEWPLPPEVVSQRDRSFEDLAR